MQKTELSLRKRLAGKLFLMLSAGLLVRVGTRVFAYREIGEIIDDGDGAVRVPLNSVYERVDGYQIVDGERVPMRRWLGFEGASARWVMEKMVRELSDKEVEETYVSLCATLALSAKHISEAVHGGLRLDEPATTICG